MQKRGQVTILIILGLVIVASVITIYAFRDRIFLSEFERSRIQSLQVPSQAEELHTYIGDCIADVIEEPIQILGRQGGYIALPSDEISRGDHNPFSNALEIFPNTEFQTAYWFYQAANGVPKIQIPTKEDMELDIAEYIDNNLATCANNQTIYESHNATTGEIVTDVTILDDEVQVIVDYPVEVNLEEFSFAFDNFYASAEFPLGSLYDTALEIMEEENENFYLEELTYDMFVLYDEIPFQWADVNCEQETWELEEVETDLKEILLNNILAVKVAKTQYDITEESDRKYFEWSALSRTNNYRANLLYSPEWPLDVQVYPLEDGELVEDTYSGLGSPLAGVLGDLFCVSSYNFVYDLKYPVLITLYDEDSDLTFQFATMVVLDNNQPRENVEGTLVLEDVGESIICNDPTIPVTVFPVEIDASGDLIDLEDTEVSFKCINSQCPLGTSRGFGIETIVPQCVNAQIVAEKDGYLRGIEIADTLEQSTITVVLEKFYELPYDIQVVDLEGNVRNPNNDETLYVSLTEIDTGYTTTVSFPPGTDTVALAAGTYTVSGTMVTESPFDLVVPGYDYTTCSAVPQIGIAGLFGLGSKTDCEDVQVEEIDVEQAISGGIDLQWTIDRADLSLANKVTFYVTTPGEPESLEEVEEVVSLLDTGIGLREPELT